MPALVGIKVTNNYKVHEIAKAPVTKKQFDEAEAKWEAESKSYRKEPKRFENHVNKITDKGCPSALSLLQVAFGTLLIFRATEKTKTNESS